MKRIFVYLSCVFLVLLFTVLGFISGVYYGGNYGCFSQIDSIFYPLRGYESCGSFGFWIGLIIGLFTSVLIILKTRK